MLPRLAAMVCMAIKGRTSLRLCSSPIISSTVNVKGTKVMSATSLVISILKKKHSIIRISTKPRPLFTLHSSP